MQKSFPKGVVIDVVCISVGCRLPSVAVVLVAVLGLAGSLALALALRLRLLLPVRSCLVLAVATSLVD